MTKKEEALDILNRLGLPKSHQNDRSALSLLAIVDIKENSDWREAIQRPIRLPEILVFIKKNYGAEHAQITRENIKKKTVCQMERADGVLFLLKSNSEITRKQTIHQFEHAGLLIKNIDEPTRPENSPNTNYAASEDLLKVLHSYGTEEFERSADDFISVHGTIAEIQNSMATEYGTADFACKEPGISPAIYNQLQADVIQKLKPQFFNEAELLYVGGPLNKKHRLNEKLIKNLNFPVNLHEKLPNVVYYEEKRNLLFLIEAVTSHGPMTTKKITEINDALKDLNCMKIYMSAFMDMKEFKKHIADIAWETEVWISDKPDHMVHFNGPKFLSGI